MKTRIIALLLLILSLDVISQDNFYVKIRTDTVITCGASLTSFAELVTPVNLKINLFSGIENEHFAYQIEDMESNIIHYSFLILHSSIDTTFFLKEGEYRFIWLYGGANIENPEIEGRTSNWYNYEGRSACDFTVDTLVSSDSISFTWQPSGIVSPQIIVAPADTVYYKVIAEHNNGSQAKDSVRINVIPLTVDTGEDKAMICGEKVLLDLPLTNYSGSDELIYSWSPAEGLDHSTVPQPTVDTVDDAIFKLTVSTPNGCVAEDSVRITVDPLTITLDSEVTVACGDLVQLNASTNYSGSESLRYEWSPDLGLSSNSVSDPFVSLTESREYLLAVQNPDKCLAESSVQVNVSVTSSVPSICMLSVDSENHNQIVVNQYYEDHIDSVVIYKETTVTNNFQRIGIISARDNQVFLDTLSNASVNSSRYKIAFRDKCGFETNQSDSHKTMHLTINSGIGGAWNLIWDKYEGFEYGTYHIYRGTSDNNLLKIAEQASNTFSYTDLTPPLETSYYQLEVVNPSPCSSGNFKSLNTDLNSSRSNIVSSNTINTIVNYENNYFNLLPNPCYDKLIIQTNGNFDKLRMSIISLDGKILFADEEYYLNSEIDLSAMEAGIYIVRMNFSGISINRKLIIR